MILMAEKRNGPLEILISLLKRSEYGCNGRMIPTRVLLMMWGSDSGRARDHDVARAGTTGLKLSTHNLDNLGR